VNRARPEGRPKRVWQPKSQLKPNDGVEEAQLNSISSPNRSSPVENPSEVALAPSITHPYSTHIASSSSEEEEAEMANFAVDPEPYIPEGLELEDWARPARGRIIVSANPPRAHEEYAIITLVPPPPPQDLYEAMEEVVEFLVEERRAFVDSSCLSLLGLCLVQFRSPVTRQAMINLSPLQLDANRQIIVQEHDRGLNLRSCPFSRTCWIMFLAFPLDYQTKEIISQAVGYFGSVITWTNNARCRSRLLLQCKVTLISRIPRSLLICQGTAIGNHGSSWSVPVFVLSSKSN
jgi:hypothetical protein